MPQNGQRQGMLLFYLRCSTDQMSTQMCYNFYCLASAVLVHDGHAFHRVLRDRAGAGTKSAVPGQDGYSGRLLYRLILRWSASI